MNCLTVRSASNSTYFGKVFTRRPDENLHEGLVDDGARGRARLALERADRLAVLNASLGSLKPLSGELEAIDACLCNWA